MNVAPSAPSTTRWSNDAERCRIRRIAIWPLPHDRPLNRLVDAENADFGMIDDRRGRDAAVAAEARDGERRIGKFVAGNRVVAGRLGDSPHFAGRLPQVHRFGMPHDRHAQAAVGLSRDAKVYGFVPRDHFALHVVVGVELRKAAQTPA